MVWKRLRLMSSMLISASILTVPVRSEGWRMLLQWLIREARKVSTLS